MHMAQLMPLPLTVSDFSKIQIGFTFLVPAHLGSPGQRADKRVCVCVSCRLTAKNRDQLRNPTLRNRVWVYLLNVYLGHVCVEEDGLSRVGQPMSTDQLQYFLQVPQPTVQLASQSTLTLLSLVRHAARLAIDS